MDDRVSWQNPRIISILLLVFLCGAVTGALVMRHHLHNTMHRVAASPTPDRMRDFTLDRFQRELNLTPEQSDEVKLVLDDFFKYYHSLQSQMDEVRSAGKSRIVRVLNEEQKQKFDKIMHELQARR
jgi:hypothetical protein